jgi:hypothetical protein
MTHAELIEAIAEAKAQGMVPCRPLLHMKPIDAPRCPSCFRENMKGRNRRAYDKQTPEQKRARQVRSRENAKLRKMGW